MCGIFGYYNYRVSKDRKAILEYLFSGLRRLEYRGYDSAGISFDSQSVPAVTAPGHQNGILSNGNHHEKPTGLKVVLQKKSATITSTPIVIKSQGKVEALVKLAYEEVAKQDIDLEEEFDNHAGVAHTRWATHGVPSAINSHPQVSDAEHGFIVVHNGIITNHRALKDFLVRFTSVLFLQRKPMHACCLQGTICGSYVLLLRNNLGTTGRTNRR